MSLNQELLFIPEIVGLDARSSIVRIPPELDVPLTPRVRRIIDSKAFRRLANISQLGFVRFVYPGATHTRFEHSLGVYRLTLLLLKRLAYDERFASSVRVQEAETLILASLLHDIGHFPYCHLLEDLKPTALDSHEAIALEILNRELASLIQSDWGLDPADVGAILLKQPPKRLNDSESEYQRRKSVFHLLSSILSGPIDVDKMDYLMRDSHGAGVPYGKNYDIDRLVGSICLNQSGDGVAITTKGKTAAELMVFARYVMFSEVYWHHAVRAATVMFQRLVDCIAQTISFPTLLQDFRQLSDQSLPRYLFESSQRVASASQNNLSEATRLCDGLFGEQRRLFKKVRQFSAMEEPTLYKRIAGRPYPELRQISYLLGQKIDVSPIEVLVDAPPVDKEVEFKIDVFDQDENIYRPLSEVSPVVRALAKEQFDEYVKRVRIFVAPEVAAKVREHKQLDLLLGETLDELDSHRV